MSSFYNIPNVKIKKEHKFFWLNFTSLPKSKCLSPLHSQKSLKPEIEMFQRNFW